MESILKLNLKKEIFEKVKNGDVNEVYFETSPFYMSRLTTNKNNTIQDLENDINLFKVYDIVEFQCSGETCIFDFLKIGLSENTEQPMFVLGFQKESKPVTDTIPVVEETEELIEESVDESPVVEESDSIEESVENDVDEIEVEDDIETDDVDDILIDFYKNKNVYTTNKSNVEVYRGKLTGCEKEFPKKNEIGQRFILKRKVFSTKNLTEELYDVLRGNYVIVFPDGVRVFDDNVEIPMHIIKITDSYGWF